MYDRMQASTISFSSTPTRRPSWERYVMFMIELMAVLVLVLLIDRSFRIAAYALGVIWFGYMIWRLLNGPKPHLSFDLADDELIIHHHRKGPTILAYADITQLCAHSVEGHLGRSHASFTQMGYSFGKWRWKKHEITLYASQRNRLVLLDTEQGLIGVSVDATDEDRFVAELSKRTGLQPVAGEFTPQHAKKALSQFPLIFFSIVLYMIGENAVRSAFPETNVYQLAMFGLFSTLVFISMRVWERVHEKIPGLLLMMATALIAYSIFFGND